MADGVTVKVDPSKVIAKFGGITEKLRNNLRRVIPELTRKLRDKVVENEKASFKTTRRLAPATRSQMIESPSQITGRVYVDSSRFPMVAALTLEGPPRGTGTYPIFPVTARMLHFYWEKGPRGPGQYTFAHVNHPYYPGRFYMKNAFDDMQEEIRERMRMVVIESAR